MRSRLVNPDPASSLQNAISIPIEIPGVGYLQEGTIFSVKGSHGRFKFVTAANNGNVIEAFGGISGHSQFRAFRPDQIRKIEKNAR